MDEPLVLACALAAEERAARKGGACAARVGLRASLPLPEGRLVSFGLAGALVPSLLPGTIITAGRVVDEAGKLLWEGEALPVQGAHSAPVCAARGVVDDPTDRVALAASTGAAAADLESGALAATGRLAGVVRVISDTPDRPLGRLAFTAKQDGSVDWRGVFAALVREPVVAVTAALAARRALASLERAARDVSRRR